MSHAKTVCLSLFLAACTSDDDEGPRGLARESGAHIVPVYVAGNPTCADLGLGSFSYKIDPPESGTYLLADGVNTVTMRTSDGVYFNWTSTVPIDAVLAKGGPNANVYLYEGGARGDTALVSPTNGKNEKPYDLSHIDFCFDYRTIVTVTAETSLSRTWSWGVDKRGAGSTLLLATGQTYLMGYDVAVGTNGNTDGNWAVSGVITVANPSPYAATVTAVTGDVDGLAAQVTCDTLLLPAWGTFSCRYAASLPDGATRTSTGTVSTTGTVRGSRAAAAVDHATASVRAVDACVTVDDDRVGSLGTVCAGAPQTFTYTFPVGPFATCGKQTFDNTARFQAVDTGLAGTDTWSVAVDVPCAASCTLTPGYWKTHSVHGPAAADDTWARLDAGADTMFFLSGETYHQLLWTDPMGNAYRILAYAYIATELNGLNGADLGAVRAAFDRATALLESLTPDTRLTAAERDELVGLAATLDAYNNGLADGGPPHCSE
jgi:hypothetical protein